MHVRTCMFVFFTWSRDGEDLVNNTLKILVNSAVICSIRVLNPGLEIGEKGEVGSNAVEPIDSLRLYDTKGATHICQLCQERAAGQKRICRVVAMR